MISELEKAVAAARAAPLTFNEAEAVITSLGYDSLDPINKIRVWYRLTSNKILSENVVMFNNMLYERVLSAIREASISKPYIEILNDLYRETNKSLAGE